MLSAMSFFLLNAGKRHEKRACFHGRLLCKWVFPAVYVVIFFCGLYTSTSAAASILNLSIAARASGTLILLVFLLDITVSPFQSLTCVGHLGIASIVWHEKDRLCGNKNGKICVFLNFRQYYARHRYLKGSGPHFYRRPANGIFRFVLSLLS